MMWRLDWLGVFQFDEFWTFIVSFLLGATVIGLFFGLREPFEDDAFVARERSILMNGG